MKANRLPSQIEFTSIFILPDAVTRGNRFAEII